MLVLSHRPQEGISLPDLGIVIRILEMKNKAVRLGIEAPSTVKILRQELGVRPDDPGDRRSIPRLSHELRNELNRLTVGLHLLRRQWEVGQQEAAAATLDGLLAALEKLDPKVLEAGPPAAAKPVAYNTLLVEDDPNERELLAGFLNLSGCKCETSGDGQDALDYLASHEKPDFVLLDMGLPRCSGPQALGQIRKNPRLEGLKIFAISGASPDECGVNIGPGGVDKWFHKPLQPQRLLEAIQKSPLRG